MSIFIRILAILLAIAFVILAYYVVVWVFAMLGIHIPQNILTVVFVIIGLMMAIAVLSGRLDDTAWWKGRP